MTMEDSYKAYLQALDEKHGKLRSCSYSSYSGGMMYNSNTILNYWLEIKDNDESILNVENKMAFEKTYKSTYRIKDEDLKELCDFIETNRFWAFSRLEFYQDPRFIVYDYSSSSGFTLYYDETSIGGSSHVYFHINGDAMHQYNFDEQYTRLKTLFSGLADKGELLSTEEYGQQTLINESFTLDPKTETPVNGEEQSICPNCGYKPVSGRFCPECGSLVKK